MKIFAGNVHGAAVGQMAAVVQAHAQHRVAGLQQGKIDAHVGLGAAVGLHVGMVGAVERLGPFDGDPLHLVHVHAAAVVALSGVALGVFVGQRAAGSGQHRRADKVFGGDQFNVRFLTGTFIRDGFGYFRVLKKAFGQLPHG